ncbi:MAG: hypothetical protein LBT44_05320, partial [Clostridiales bacterium]|jgi:ATP-dependent helicase/DNAse subunit B|nr:hypothetical protein [Clostridiales bacterium]
MFSEDYNAMKNHYLLIQIGHAISQLMEQGLKLMTQAKMSLNQFHEEILNDFKNIRLTDADMAYAGQPCQIRFY